MSVHVPAAHLGICAPKLAVHCSAIATCAVCHQRPLLAFLHAVAPVGGSSRYTHSTASADAAELSSGSDDDDDENAGYAHASDPGDDLSHQQQQHRRRQLHWDAAGSAGAAGAGVAADSDDEDDLCQWQGGLSPPQHLPQQQAQGLGALRDISNSSRMAQGHRHSQQHLKQKQQQDAAGSSRAAEDAACNAVHVEQDGRLLVEAQVLQLLLDKVCLQICGLARRRTAAAPYAWCFSHCDA